MTDDAHSKGVMLCQRPAEVRGAAGGDLLPFRPSNSTLNLDPVGLTPPRKVVVSSAGHKAVTASTKHKQFVRELEAGNKEARWRSEEAAMAAMSTAAGIAEFNAKLRATILAGGGSAVDTFWRPAAHATSIKQQQMAESQRDSSRGGSTTWHVGSGAASTNAKELLVDVESFVDRVVEEAESLIQQADAHSTPAEGGSQLAAPMTPPASSAHTPQPSTVQTGRALTACHIEGAAGSQPETSATLTSTAPKKRPKGNKPAWAFSLEEADGLLACEEAELLDFASGLDFDGFLSQLEDTQLKADLQDLRSAEDEEPDKGVVDNATWRRTFVRALNHAALRGVQGQARANAGGEEDDAGSVAGHSDAHQSSTSRGTLTSIARSAMTAEKRQAAAAAAGGGLGAHWETSTRANEDDVGRMQWVKSKQREAEEFLRENPELRVVHSPASVRSMLLKTELAAPPA